MSKNYFDLTDEIVDAKGLLVLEPSVEDIETMISDNGCIATDIDIWFSERLDLWVWSCKMENCDNVYN